MSFTRATGWVTIFGIHSGYSTIYISIQITGCTLTMAASFCQETIIQILMPSSKTNGDSMGNLTERARISLQLCCEVALRLLHLETRALACILLQISRKNFLSPAEFLRDQVM